VPYCPECLREFDVAGGYCPHDGKTLKAGKPPGKRAESAGEDAALARLQAHGVGVENEETENYDRYLGTTFDHRYKITRKLGEGGMGVVFYARHVVIEKPVAIKVLKKSVSRDPSVVARFIQEAKAASRIGHPNIVDVTDFGTTEDGLAYQVMEYLEGPTLADLIYTRKRVPVDEALPILVQMARALAAAHDKGIVHRDLKPENIFLIERHGRDDFVKIVDFGIAKVTATEDGKPQSGPKLTRAGAVFGTPEYMAPEQASGSTDIDHRVDVYSLGAIFYEMLAGRVPLHGANTVRTLAMVILDEVPALGTTAPDLELPEGLEALVMKALSKKREGRFANMGEIADALEAIAGKSLSPRIGPGLGSMPPTTSSVAAQPDTVPEVGVPDMELGAEPSAPVPRAASEAEGSRPIEQVDRRPRRSRASTFDPPFVETANPGFDAIPEPRLTEFLDLKKKSSAPLVIASLIFLGGVGLAGYFLFTSGEDEQAAADASALVAPDAQPVAAAIVDAGAAPAEDASTAAAAIDAGSKRVSGKHPVKTPVEAGQTTLAQVIVHTRPEGGRVFVDGNDRGPDGVTLDMLQVGTTIKVTCKLAGYKDGFKTVAIRDPKQAVICDMKKQPRCMKDLKNPFDECP